MMNAAAAPILALRRIVTRFGDNVVHDGLNLCVERGEVVSLVGGSGTGKTTLLRHIIGLTRPAAGEVELFGEPLFAGNLAAQRAPPPLWCVIPARRAVFCLHRGRKHRLRPARDAPRS